jgi:hypothetical protein
MGVALASLAGSGAESAIQYLGHGGALRVPRGSGANGSSVAKLS